MKHIRPWEVFNLLAEESGPRLGSLYLPHKNSVTLSLETLLLVTLVRVLKPRVCFEFGTFKGETTLSLAANLENDAKIYTLDLDQASAEAVTFERYDQTLSRQAVRTKPVFVGTVHEPRVRQIHGDSLRLDCSPWKEKMDFIFVDGNHLLPYVKKDTENAFKMLSGRGCIVWHDYGDLAVEMAGSVGADAEAYRAITAYLDELSRKRTLYHIEDTRLAVYSADKNFLKGGPLDGR